MTTSAKQIATRWNCQRVRSWNLRRTLSRFRAGLAGSYEHDDCVWRCSRGVSKMDCSSYFLPAGVVRFKTRANLPDKLSQTRATKLIGLNTIALVLPGIVA
jgi:hypothetical protein